MQPDCKFNFTRQVPVLDTVGMVAGRDPVIVVVYCHSAQDVFVTTSSTLGCACETCVDCTLSAMYGNTIIVPNYDCSILAC